MSNEHSIETLLGEQGVEYRPIRDWPGYAVGNDGSVWSCRNNGGKICNDWKKLSPRISRYGYCRIELNLPNKKGHYFVHRLVLENFVGPCPPGMLTRHFPDHTKTNNALTNLQWGTGKENQADRKLQGSYICGSHVKNSLLTGADVIKMRELFATGNFTKTELAKMFGVSRHAVYLIIVRRNWAWL